MVEEEFIELRANLSSEELRLPSLHREREDLIRTTFQALLSGDRATKSVS